MAVSVVISGMQESAEIKGAKRLMAEQHITIVIPPPPAPPAPPPSRPVLTALIGAAALIAAAIVAGVFAVLAQLVPTVSQHFLGR